LTHTEAKVEFVHDCALEFEDKDIGPGALEIVQDHSANEEVRGLVMVQIYKGDTCARAWITQEDLEEIMAELAGMEWVGSSGGVNFYGPKAET